MTSTLPLALGKLQSEGEIRRIPMNGRIDQQRYRYSRWTPNPLSRFELPAEEAYTELARRYFTWIGPATLAQFQWFSGLGVKVARAAIEPLKLAPLASGEEHLIPPDLRAEFETFKLSPKPQYVLVSSLDGMTHLRRNLRDLVAPEDLSKKVFCDKEFKQLGGLMDLYSHAILDRGRVVGLWDYDFEAQSIVWISFIGESDALRDAVRRTEEFVREDLGDARSFSLDSPKSRVPRLKALRGG
jgi:hypothetical protein